MLKLGRRVNAKFPVQLLIAALTLITALAQEFSLAHSPEQPRSAARLTDS